MDNGSKIFQTKRIVHIKAHKHRRPWSQCHGGLELQDENSGTKS